MSYFEEDLDLALGRVDVPPSPATYSRAREWLARIDQTAEVGHHFATSPEGEIVIEFFRGGKTLTVYVGEERVEGLKSWGRSVLNEMAEEKVETVEEAREAWTWLLS